MEWSMQIFGLANMPRESEKDEWWIMNVYMDMYIYMIGCECGVARVDSKLEKSSVSVISEYQHE